MSISTSTTTPAGSATRACLARRLRRYTGGIALALFPALLAVEAPIDPAGDGTGEMMYSAATEHAEALGLSAALLFISGILMIPAVTAILHQARDRGSALANTGAVLGVLGGLGHVAIALFYLFALALPGGDQAQMVSYVERVNSSAVGAVAFPLILCFALGVLVLGWAAWRAGLIGWWGPVAVTAAVLVAEVLPAGIPALQVAANALATVVFGFLGLRVIRMTDTDWDGVRPAA